MKRKIQENKGCFLSALGVVWIFVTWLAFVYGMMTFKYSWRDGVAVANPPIVKVLPALIVLIVGVISLLVMNRVIKKR